MSITDRDKKILWARAGNSCSYRYGGEICDKELVMADGKDVVVSEECHIIGKKPNTARYIKDFPERDSYSNLILLCRNHHKLVDDNPGKYPVELLRDMKVEHEKFIKERIDKGEIERLVIKDAEFSLDAKDTEEATVMEVDRPAQLLGVKAMMRAKNVGRATVFKTNQGLTSAIMSCPNCGKSFPYVCTGPKPERISCPICGEYV